jgi:hypothetical protein
LAPLLFENVAESLPERNGIWLVGLKQIDISYMSLAFGLRGVYDGPVDSVTMTPPTPDPTLATARLRYDERLCGRALSRSQTPRQSVEEGATAKLA